MDSNRKGRRFKWLVRAFAAGAACLAGILLGICLSRVDLANYAANRVLQDQGYVGSHVRFSRLDLTESILQSARLQTDAFTVEVEDAQISYESDTLWNENTLRSIQVSHLNLWFNSPESSSESSGFDPGELERQIKRFLPLPLESLEIKDASIQATTEQGTFSGNAALQLSQDAQSGIQARLSAQTDEADLELDLALDENIEFSADVSSENVREALSRYGLDLKSLLELPENASLEPSSAKARVTGHLSDASLDEAAIELDLGPVHFNASGSSVDVRSLKAELALDSEGRVRDLKASLDLESAVYGSLAIDETRIEIAAPTPQAFSLSLPETRWRSESGERGALDATIQVQLDNENGISQFAIQGTSSELVSGEFAANAFSFSIEGEPELITLSTSPLVLEQYPWLRLENLKARIEEADTDNPLVNLTATLILDSEDDASVPFAGSWEMTATLRPQAAPQTIDLELKPNGTTLFPASSIAQVEGKSALKLSLKRWPADGTIALAATLSVSDVSGSIQDWTIDGGAAEATLEVDSLALPEFLDALNQPSELVELMARSGRYAFSFQGNQLAGPDNSSAQWFSGTLRLSVAEQESADPIQADFEIGVGIARAAAETLQQVFLKTHVAGSTQRLQLESQADLLFEGEPISVTASQTLNLETEVPSLSGPFAIKGIKLVSSDILFRQNPTLSGTTVSARVGIEGEIRLAPGEWDAAATLRVQEGAFAYPTEDIAIEGVETTFSFDSLARLRSQPSQKITAARMTLGDLEATDLALQLSLDGLESVTIEKAQLSTFDGSLALDPVTLSLENPEAELTVRFKQISIAPAIAMLDFFDGEVNGRLNGFLPISLVNGRPVLGEGFLELDSNSAATFSYNAQGAFTTPENNAGEIPKSMGDKLLERLGLEPNALLEEALGNLKILDLKVDLFNQNLVGTPMRVQLSGIADTGEVQIPLNLTTNFNGTVADLLDFFLRLDSLGLVVEESGFSE